MTRPVRIDRCVCQRLPFTVLLPIARARAWSIGDLIREGETVFFEALEDVA